MTSKKVKIVKVPLPPELKSKNIPANFPNMPILYLELIENKGKIKPEFVNKEYIPKKKAELQFVDDDKSDRNEDERDERDKKDEDERRSDNGGGISPSPERSQKENFSQDEEDFDPGFEEDEQMTNDEMDEGFRRPSPEVEKSISRSSGHSNGSRHSQESIHSNGSNRSRRSSKKSSDSEKHERRGDKKISRRLKELLEESDEEVERRKPETETYTAPSLKELEKSGKFTRKKEIEDVGHTSLNQQEEEDSKRELLFKFELLKKSYKTDNIPEFTIHSDYNQMKKTYESTLRTLSLDKSVEDYKKYLIGGFMLMEFVCGSWLGFDMSGFTQQQIISMNSYEKLLIELGEKSYVPSGSKWPVEVRLLFLVIMNAAFFIISKMILKKTGSNLMNMMNSMNATVTAPVASVAPKKRKMKGPSISVDDIPDVTEAESVNGSVSVSA